MLHVYHKICKLFSYYFAVVILSAPSQCEKFIHILQGFDTLNGKTSYYMISRRLEVAGLGIEIIVSLWILTDSPAELLRKRLSIFKAIVLL